MMPTIPATHLILKAGSYSPNVSPLNAPFRSIHLFNMVLCSILVRILEKKVALEKRKSVAYRQ